MLNRTLTIALLTGCVALNALHAGVTERRATPRSALAVEPTAPVADRPAALIRASLASNPVEPIPIGGFGPFGQSAGEDIAPVAPQADPGWSVLDLRTDPEPADVAAPVTTAP